MCSLVGVATASLDVALPSHESRDWEVGVYSCSSYTVRAARLGTHFSDRLKLIVDLERAEGIVDDRLQAYMQWSVCRNRGAVGNRLACVRRDGPKLGGRLV